MEFLKMTIHKIKCVDDLTVCLPVQRGLYAITGQNGSGKSTIAACASSAFFNLQMIEYFGTTDPDSSITFEFKGKTKVWFKKEGRRWRHVSPQGFIGVNGFFEGSLIYGNRFRDTSFEKVRRLERISSERLEAGDEFIRTNLGRILQGNPNFYERLLKLDDASIFNGTIFFYEKDGRRISQFHMSTGENLLISILNSLLMRIQDRSDTNTPCLVILDEIELALHPSSLKRLMQFLKEMSMQYNYAVYFSTHSLELIGDIAPDNIFYIQRHANNTVGIINPCYPAYATKMLYEHDGYDHVVLVEDDLAKSIIETIILQEKLRTGRQVHVLPCGGYANVIDMANEVVQYNLMGRQASLCCILDGDVQNEVNNYCAKHGIRNNVRIGFLPIASLEKFLKQKLYDDVDHELYRKLDDYVFQQKSIANLKEEYEAEFDPQTDRNGKKYFTVLERELKARNTERSQLVRMIVEHFMEHSTDSVARFIQFLKERLGFE